MDKTVKVMVVLFAAVGIGLFGYHWLGQWHTKAVDQALKKEQTAHLEKIAQLEAEIHKLTQEMDTAYQSLPSKSELTNVFGEAKPMDSTINESVDCNRITGQVVAFFHYLDSKAYLIWPDINMRAETLFDEIAKKLAAHPPTNVGEMEDLYSLIRNVTHLYRVLGKDRVNLIKEILKSEAAVSEPAMAVMFSWMTTCGKTTLNGVDHPKLKTLYQYACFFLNTLGGRSYLLRRETKLRLLVNYYSVMVVDRANDAKINAYGLDIRPHLDHLLYDINNQKGLMYRQRYLSQLSALINKYQ
jgi:hypothetical protein